MEKKIAPSEQKAQALRAVLQGQLDGQGGEELLSTIVRLSTERILQEALEHEQAEALGRGRYEARGEKLKLDEQEVSMSEAFVYAPTRRSATSAA